MRPRLRPAVEVFACTAAVTVLVGCGRDDVSPAPAQAGTPIAQQRFEDYAVADTARGRERRAEVRLASAPYGRMYRTRLREGAGRGPNFAGHFTVVLWGCGTGCQMVAVVDARTGRLSRETLLAANGVDYRRTSRLLLADPRTPETPPDCASCGTPAYYEWRGSRFDLSVRGHTRTSAGHDPGRTNARPPTRRRSRGADRTRARDEIGC